jgi:hypothetical protein
LQFILENPILIIIIIGMITSFMKRRKASNEPNPNTQKNAVPEWKKMMDFPQSFEEVRQEYSKPVTVSPTVVKEYNEVPKVVKQDNREARTPQKERRVNPTHVETKTQPSISMDPDRDALINGIIWSEVLGPPRALKSHRQSRQMPKR